MRKLLLVAKAQRRRGTCAALPDLRGFRPGSRPGLSTLARLGAIAFATLTALVPLAPAHAIWMQALNSRVVLDLPAGFTASKLFSGFQNETSGVSYVILELPLKAYDELAAGFEGPELAKRGLTDPEKGTLPRSDTHIYMRARQQTAAGAYAKFFVLFKTSDQTVLVSANAPLSAIEKGTIDAADIERVLTSAHTANTASTQDLYTVGYLGPFRFAGTLVGTSTLYTLDGRMEPERKGEVRSTLIVAPSLDQRGIPDPAKLATTLLSSLTGFKGISPGPPQRQTIDGVAAVTIDANAVDSDRETPVLIHQTLLLPKAGGYIRVLGIATAADKERLAPEFARIAESIVLKP